ncbi:AarF/ABC1/UbiB kinase family protein [Kocuria sp. p3-SID1433]|uniref:ABC1 kinase family protein n=1 Tax=unclassified Kocuria TaxID=2649579 RepID=UPI0021A88A0C|nr:MULTISPECIES: AarF/ABC1/UbiB kinase family protein [unclassified Kocuria]MCT1601369.1 AarF/ABC1/UbiB kinase family protein [Kocuria sp. p3-SID1428]MCT2180037.1 AarF/ABC1/UbiB kinase family protein [Kocuria sp. p3-SID1433]
MLSRRERLFQILEVLSQHGFGFVLAGLKPEWRAPLERVRLVDPEKVRPQPVHLRLALEELGPTFVKLGQLASTRPDLLPQEYARELARLQDSSPPIPPDRIRELLEQEPDTAAEEILRHIDPVPLATGSIGQAHTAVYDGMDVVVKIRRPGIVDTVNRDLEVLRELAVLITRYWPGVGDQDLTGLVDQFAASMRDELDYLAEARSTERMRELFAGHPSLIVPAVVWQATSSRVLTTERMSGMKITDHAALEAAGVDRHQLAVTATQILCQMIFDHGFFHADPHPGNLFIHSDGSIAMIDFGMVGSLSEEFRDALVTMLVGVSQGNARRATTGLLKLTDRAPENLDRAALDRDVESMIRSYADRPLAEVRMAALLSDLVACLRRHRLRLPRDSALFLRMVITAESIGKGLDPDFDLISVIRPFARQFVLRRVSPEALLQRVRGLVEEAVQLGQDSPDVIRRVMSVLENGGFDVHLRADELEPLLNRGERIGHQVIAGAVIAATINGMSHVVASEPQRYSRFHVPLMIGGTGTVGVLSAYLAASTATPRVRRIVSSLRERRRRTR